MSLAPMRATAPRVEPRRESEPARPRLRIVGAAAPDAARAPYFALCVAILLGALLGALALNTSMAATAYTIRDRTLELSSASIQAETLATQVEQAAAPSQVMARAAALGLVPSGGVIYVDLASGTLVGGQQ